MTMREWVYVMLWCAAVAMAGSGMRFLFASNETLLRNADKLHTNNPIAARFVALVFLILGAALTVVMLAVPCPLF